eukprot:7756804-Alexandrium_andersonii.AAC.1
MAIHSACARCKADNRYYGRRRGRSQTSVLNPMAPPAGPLHQAPLCRARRPQTQLGGRAPRRAALS